MFPVSFVVAASDEEDAEEAAEEADGHAPAQFAQGVLAEDDAGGADHAAEEYAEAEPARGVEGKDEGKGHERTDDAARGCGVRAHLDDAVEQGTDNLDGQRSGYHAERETRHVERVEHFVERGVAHDAHGVGHVAPFAAAQLVARPTVDLAVDIDEQARQHYGEEVDKQREQQLRQQWQHVQVAEGEEGGEGHHGKVERGEEMRHHLGGEHYPTDAAVDAAQELAGGAGRNVRHVA